MKLRFDNFDVFFQARQKNLLNRIEQAMGKSSIPDPDSNTESELIESTEYDE